MLLQVLYKIYFRHVIYFVEQVNPLLLLLLLLLLLSSSS